MATLKEEAKQYKPQSMKNISELPFVETDVFVLTKTVKDDDGTEREVKYMEVGEEDYRIPASVLKSLKVILEDNPDLKKFKVRKEGEGLKTQYTVIPLA